MNQIIILWIIFCLLVNGAAPEEPLCTSRFDFEYKMLNKIVEFEHRLQANELKAEERLRAHELQIKTQQGAIEKLTLETKGRGAVYNRWGRNECSHDSSMIYNGFIGGKKYSDKGSGSDSLCLPAVPTWSNFTDGLNGNKGYIYGTETDLDGEKGGYFENDVNQQDMPCAVCKSIRSTTIMIPARTSCYKGWSLEYSGYLMTAFHGHDGPHSYICVDAKPDFLPKGGGNDNEHILYLVEAVCGSLPCPPYVNGRELACVVCSY